MCRIRSDYFCFPSLSPRSDIRFHHLLCVDCTHTHTHLGRSSNNNNDCFFLLQKSAVYKNRNIHGIDNCVILKKNGPNTGIVIIKSKSTNKSLPSCANPCMIAVLMTLTLEYRPNTVGISRVFVTLASSSPNRNPSSVA
jgi:hypothetical protein